MSEDGSVLAQAEIDALFRQATGTSIVRPTTTTVAPAPVAPPPPVLEKPVVHIMAAPLEPPKVQPAPATPRVTVMNERPHSPRPSETHEVKSSVTEQQIQLDALARRIAKLETSLQEIARSVSQGNKAKSSVAPQQINELTSTLRKVVKQTANMQKGLEGTPAYNLADEFTCSECGSHGHMAIPVSCTNCNTEGWWGWWPAKDE
jgi:hypothetical protein